jgi:tetratricopeptide (TPR) repeat protein
MQALWKAQPETDTSDVVTGTIIVSACYVQDRPLSDLIADYSPLLATKPVQRFGNLLIFRGTFVLPNPRASRLFYRALDAEYSESPDLAKAEMLLSRSLEAKPKVYSRWIELGNILIQLGKREEAVRAYQNAGLYAPEGDEIIVPLNQQVQRVLREDLKSLPPLRNPELE